MEEKPDVPKRRQLDSFNILRTRIDKFGVTQPNIQRQEGTGRIRIELPEVDNPERVRKLTGDNIGRQVAIVLDDYVYSAPVV